MDFKQIEKMIAEDEKNNSKGIEEFWKENLSEHEGKTYHVRSDEITDSQKGNNPLAKFTKKQLRDELKRRNKKKRY